MTATFLVTLNIETTEASALLDIAEDIHTDLASNFDVQSVAPWARANLPTAAPAGGFSSLATPPNESSL